MIKNFNRTALLVPKYLTSVEIIHSTIVLTTTVDFFYNLVLFLKKNTFFKCSILTDIAVVDHNKLEDRFEVNYIFLSVKFNQRVIVKFFINENVSVDSLTSLYSASS